MSEQLKIYLPISCNGSGDGKTGWAMAMATAFNGRYIQMQVMSGSHADRACNNMANAFLETDCDVMGIIDIDTEGFTERDIARVVAHFARGVRAVWGIYPKKQDDTPPCINTWPEVPPPDGYGLVNVRRAGRGFLFVHRSVFEALKEENGGPAIRYHNHGKIEWRFFHSGVVFGDYSTITKDAEGQDALDADGFKMGEWISEDWMFCEDIRHFLGIPTLVDTGIVLAHIGSKTYRFPPERVVQTNPSVKTWQDIHGWFDYEDLYRRLVNEVPDGGAFAEVGCWMGRSLAAFDAFAQESRKTIQIHAVDTFQGEPANDAHRALLFAHGGSVESVFRGNMETLGVSANVIVGDSAMAATMFADAALDAAFIDADHSEEAVLKDIHAWLPKVKPGGILCGHDFDEPGVLKAVFRAGLDVEEVGRCWVYRKPL